jgi:type IV secretory pathway TrbF-like protein
MLGSQLRRKSAVSGARKPPQNAYLAARSNFEGLFRDQAKEKHAWKIAALAELAIIAVLVLAYVQIASTSRVVPYVVEVDQLGQAVAFGPAEPLTKTDQRVTVRDLTTLIRNLRSITPDPGLQVQMIQDAYAFLDPSAASFLNAYFADPQNDPRLLGQELRRDVEVTSVLPIPNSDSWKVQWTETERSYVGNLPNTRAWEAYLTVNHVPPKDAETIQANPLGLYVTGINWTRIQTPQRTEGVAP